MLPNEKYYNWVNLMSERLKSDMRRWMTELRVIVDHAPKPLDDRAYKIYEEIEDYLPPEE